MKAGPVHDILQHLPFIITAAQHHSSFILCLVRHSEGGERKRLTSAPCGPANGSLCLHSNAIHSKHSQTQPAPNRLCFPRPVASTTYIHCTASQTDCKAARLSTCMFFTGRDIQVVRTMLDCTVFDNKWLHRKWPHRPARCRSRAGGVTELFFLHHPHSLHIVFVSHTTHTTLGRTPIAIHPLRLKTSSALLHVARHRAHSKSSVHNQAIGT